MKSLLNQKECFKERLLSEFYKKKKNNLKYSLRAFARDLLINDSTLSKILSGKRNLTSFRIKKIGYNLGLTEKEIKKYIRFNEDKKNGISAPNDKIKQLQLDQFLLASKWYFDALIELSKLNNIKADSLYLSKILNLRKNDVEIAIESLKRLGFIKVDEKNNLKCQLSSSLFNFDNPKINHKELRKYQSDILDKSKLALEKTPIEQRNHTSFIVAVNKNYVSEINELIREPQKKLVSEIKKMNPNFDSVYAIQFTSFPIINDLKKRKEKS